MVSINTVPNYSLLPPQPIFVVKLPAISLPPEAFLGLGQVSERRRPPSAVCANLGFSSLGTWVSKRMHYSFEGSQSVVCKGWESKRDSDLESEIFDFMKKSENPAAFPTKEELLDAGRVDLVDAIKKKGGWLSLGWDSDEENEVHSSQEIDITDMNKPKRHQANGRPSQERVSSDSDSLEMEDAQETGIEGILSGLKKHRRNLSLGDNLAKDSYSAPASSKLGRDDSHAENAKDDDTTDSGNSLKLQDWIYQRAGFSFENFEAGEITYRNPRIHEKENQLNKQFAITESSNEVLDKQNNISNEEMHDRIQYLELQLATALRLLRSKSEKYAADEVDATFDDLLNLSDALEFHQNDIIKTRRELRSIQAKYAVLEKRMERSVKDVQMDIEKKERRVRARKALALLRSTCIYWPNLSATEILLAGSFDGWTTRRKMERSPSSIFSVCLMLYPGRYEIKFIVDGEWRVDWLRPVINHGNICNNVLTVE